MRGRAPAQGQALRLSPELTLRCREGPCLLVQHASNVATTKNLLTEQNRTFKPDLAFGKRVTQMLGSAGASYISAMLLKRCQVNAVSGCWEWPGKSPYPQLRMYGMTFRINRLALWLRDRTFDLSDPTMYACHTCDNKRCVNPEHLFIGDNRLNQLDASEKGRLPRGEKSKLAKITAKQVLAIRKARNQGVSVRQLCTRYNLEDSQIYRIINKQNWKHV